MRVPASDNLKAPGVVRGATEHGSSGPNERPWAVWPSAESLMRSLLHLRLQVAGPFRSAKAVSTNNHTFATGDLGQASVHKVVATSELTSLVT